MPNLKRDSGNLISPQYLKEDGSAFEEVMGRNGGINTNTISLTKEHIFHDEEIAVSNGTPLTVGGYKTLTVEIYGTSTSRTIAFIGRGLSGEDRAIVGEKLSSISEAVSTKETDELWRFNITGLVTVIMDLQDVAGGNVTVKGVVVT